jgi:GT2 family glycosyltransferase
MNDVPSDIAALVTERDVARAARDFAKADELRAQIEAAGFVITDTPAGATVTPAPRYQTVEARDVPNELAEPPTLDASIHLLYEGFPNDVARFVEAFRAHCDTARAELILVDNASGDGEALEQLDGVRVLHLSKEVGWAPARNAGLKTSKGAIVVLADLSIEPTGDMLTPLLAVFEDPTVGAAGPFGLVSDDLRDWREDPGPEVGALEGYLLATRREVLAEGLIHEKFRWYRNADIDLSFQIRSQGLRAVVVPVPVDKHTHRGWAALEDDPAEREKRSKRNHYLFFDRWKDQGLSGNPGA